MYDYKDGKLDWLSAGLPSEGSNARRPRAGTVARKDAPTCRVDEQLGPVRDRVRAAGWTACAVVNDDGVVFGFLRDRELGADPERRIEDIMRAGPSTFRPHVGIGEMAEFMTEHELASSPITTSDGRLVGILLREDAVNAAHREHERQGK